MIEIENNDMLEACFERQKKFMNELLSHDRLPEYPVDLTTKAGQRLLKEVMFNMIEEMMEASFTLKNRMHKLSDDKKVDIEHFIEEIGDSFAYFIELCVLAGLDAKKLNAEHERKNKIVFDRLRNGY